MDVWWDFFNGKYDDVPSMFGLDVNRCQNDVPSGGKWCSEPQDGNGLCWNRHISSGAPNFTQMPAAPRHMKSKHSGYD